MQALLPAEPTAYPSETIQYWSHLDLEIHCFLLKNLEFSNLLLSYGINLRSVCLPSFGQNYRLQCERLFSDSFCTCTVQGRKEVFTHTRLQSKQIAQQSLQLCGQSRRLLSLS